MGPISDTVQDAKAWWQSKTIIGTIILIVTYVIRIVKPEWASIEIEAGVNEVFDQAQQIASQADALWVTLSQSLGAILVALGLRNPEKRPVTVLGKRIS